MRMIDVKMIVERQKETIKNLELLELLQTRKLYFPRRYKKTVVELAERHSQFITIFEPFNNKVYLSYSGNCGTLYNERVFKTEFAAIEYALISSLNGRKTQTEYTCRDVTCDICSSFLVA